jgi:hypothetical protein
LRFFIEKFNFTWKSDYDFFYWATVRQNDAGVLRADPKDIGHIIMPITDAFHIFVLVFSTIGAVYCAFEKREPISLILALFIIGFSIILLITEVQQRYRSVLHSCLPIFCVFGIFWTNKLLIRVKRKLAIFSQRG